MAAELQLRADSTGTTTRATISKALTVGGKVQMCIVSSGAFEDMTVANWATYLITMTETPASSYCYIGTWPASLTTAGWYLLNVYAGTAISNARIDTQFGYWNGTIFDLSGTNIVQTGGTAYVAGAIPAVAAGTLGGLFLDGVNTGTVTMQGGIVVTQYTAGSAAIAITGGSTGAGVTITAGTGNAVYCTTGGSVSVVKLLGYSSNTDATTACLELNGNTTSSYMSGLRITSGGHSSARSAVHIQGISTGASGIVIAGGSSSFTPNASGHAIELAGLASTSNALFAKGGSAASSILIQTTSPGSGNTYSAVELAATIYGNGLKIIGGSSAGHGVWISQNNAGLYAGLVAFGGIATSGQAAEAIYCTTSSTSAVKFQAYAFNTTAGKAALELDGNGASSYSSGLSILSGGHSAGYGAVYIKGTGATTAAMQIMGSGGTAQTGLANAIFINNGTSNSTVLIKTAAVNTSASTAAVEIDGTASSLASGLLIKAGTGSGALAGIYVTAGNATSAGIIINGGSLAAPTTSTSGVHIVSSAVDGAGVTVLGGSSGDGVRIGANTAPTSGGGIGLYISTGVSNKSGVSIVGNGNSTGFSIASGTGGIGMSVTGNSANALTLTGPVALSSTLAVTGTTTLTGAVSLGATLAITGALTVPSITMSGALQAATITSTGATTLNSLVITGAASVGTTTTLTGAVSLGSTLGITGIATATNAGNNIAGIKGATLAADQAVNVTKVAGNAVTTVSLVDANVTKWLGTAAATPSVAGVPLVEASGLTDVSAVTAKLDTMLEVIP